MPWTLNVVCLSLFAASLLGTVADQPDVLIGTVSQNRQLFAETEGMVGFFVATTPVRVAFADCTFAALFDRVQGRVLQAMALQACPFEALAQRYGLQLDVFFSVVDYVPHLDGAEPVAQNATPKFALELEVERLEHSGQLRLLWQFDSNRVSEDRVRAAAAMFKSLMQRLSSIAVLPVLSLVLPAPAEVASLYCVVRDVRLDLAVLELRAKHLFEQRPLLRGAGSVLSVGHVQSEAELHALWEDEGEPDRAAPFALRLFSVGEEGGVGVMMTATACDKPSLRVLLEQLVAGTKDEQQQQQQQEHPGAYDLAASCAFLAPLLAEAPVFADVACDRLRPAVLGARRDVFVGNLTPEVAALDALTLTCVVGVVLGAHCVRQPTVLVGHVVREHAPTAVGLCSNVFPLRVDCSGDATLGAIVQGARAALAGAPRPLTPFHVLASALDPDCGASRTRLVQIAVEAADGGAARLEFQRSTGGCALPAELCVERRPTQLLWFFRECLWKEATVRLFHEHVAAFARNLVSPDVPTRDVSMVGAAELQLLRNGFLQRRTCPQATRMHQHFERRAKLQGDAVAIWHRGSTLTYGELDSLAARVPLGSVAPGSRIAVLCERHPLCIVAQLAVLKRGCIFVPIDTTYPLARIEFILNDAAVSAVLVQPETRRFLPASFVDQSNVVVLSRDQLSAAAPVASESAHNDGEGGAKELCYIMYTSGTTGNPKGVRVRHCGVVNYIESWSAMTECSPSDRVLWFAGVAFDASIENIWCTLSCGACVVVRTDMWLDDLRECTMMDCTPSALTIVEPAAYPRLRFVSTGAEELQVSLRNLWKSRVRLFNLYGPTEVSIATTGTWLRGDGDERDLVTIGQPFDNMRAYVVDARGALCPLGAPGELCFAGVQVAEGYHNRPDLTRDKFVPNTHLTDDDPDAAVCYRTGDLARLAPDGNVYFLGRLDSQVKLRGFRVELSSVESVILEVSGVKATTVVVENAGQPDAFLVAYVAPLTLSKEALHRACALKLPPYMVPRFMLLEAIPKTSNGKIDKRALPKLCEPHSQQQQQEEDASMAAAAAAKDDAAVKDAALAAMEQEMLAICERVMHHKLGLKSRFFDNGLNSISAMKLAYEMKQHRLDVEVTDVVREQSVASLARFCFAKSSSSNSSYSSLASLSSLPTAEGTVVRLSAARAPSRQAPCAVVLVHGVSGALAEMRLLARALCALNDAVLVYGVHLVRSSALRSVQQLAYDHIAALKRACGSVPFVLVGTDVAGAVAYEMAHQLTRAGDQVCELLLLGKPFVDERAYLQAEQEALATLAMRVLGERAVDAADLLRRAPFLSKGDVKRHVDMSGLVSGLCNEYAKKTFSVLPAAATLYVPQEYVVDGMQEVLESVLFASARVVPVDSKGSARLAAAERIHGVLLEQQSSLSTSSMLGSEQQLLTQSRRNAAAPPATTPFVGGAPATAPSVEKFTSLAQSQLRQSILGVSEVSLQLDKSTTVTHLGEMEADVAMPLPFLHAPKRAPPLLSADAEGALLLTGATGFLGPFVLRDLLLRHPRLSRVYCVARGADAEERVMQGVEPLLPEQAGQQWRQRVRVLNGDLSAPRFALPESTWQELARETDFIVHNGAYVNHVLEYHQMRATNVIGVVQILELASHEARPKRVVVVSTTGVVPVLEGETPNTPALESTELVKAHHLATESGYCQTKWVAEQLCVRAIRAGMALTIVRPALIGWSRQGGVPNPLDWVTGLIYASLFVADAVPITKQRITLLPVDECAAGVLLPLTVHCAEPVIHLSHTVSNRYSRLFDGLRRASGKRLPDVPFAQWLASLRAKSLHCTADEARLLAPSLLILGGLGDCPGDRQHSTLRAQHLGMPVSAELDDDYFAAVGQFFKTHMK